MAVVLSLVAHRARKLQEMFAAFAEYASQGEAIGFIGAVRWADGTEQMVAAGPYEDSAQAIKAALKIKRLLLEDSSF